MNKRVSDILVDLVLKAGIKDCFMLVGGGAMHLNNALAIESGINKFFNHHEQACAMAAEGYARLTGRLPLVCVTSGPGGTNTLNGVQGAWSDNLPMIIVSGHPRLDTTVSATNGLNLRTRGVQEFNIVDTVKYMTKYSVLLTRPEDIRYEVEKAIHIATTGRRGPVWIDIPLDIQSSVIDDANLRGYESLLEKYDYADSIQKLLDLVGGSQRPCILTGSGLRTSNAVNEFRELAKKIKIPIIGGALQADILYESFPLYYGMSGNVGPRAGNFILQNSDLIIVMGNSLSFKQTGFNQNYFAPNAKIAMIDIEGDESKKPGLSVDFFIKADLKEFLYEFLQFSFDVKINDKWVSYCDNILKRFSTSEGLDILKPLKNDERISNAYFWDVFRNKAKKDEIIALGNSSCILGILQRGILYKDQRVLVNYNTGSMGDDIPEAIGAAVASKKRTICVTGDGSFMLNMQELQTIKYYKLPIKIVVFSNDGYNAIRQTCKNFFNEIYIGCDEKSGISFPNFEKIANAFDIPFKRCHNNGELESCIDWLLEDDNACFLEILQKLDDPAIPKVMSRLKDDGTFETPALHDMYPFIDKDEIDKWMIK